MKKNALTIDVEDYFQVSAFCNYISKTDWNSLECRVEQNVQKILTLLEAQRTHATFFVLGWVAQKFPQLVRSIVDHGHELASHGFNHDKLHLLTPEQFSSDIQRAKAILEDVSGSEIKGYRAPSFSINNDNLWVYDYLKNAGYSYSSSIYPIQHDHYGMPNSPRFIYQMSPEFWEIPISTVRMFKRNFPASGGGYFRLLPYSMSRWLFAQIIENDKQPLVFYFHPWEIDVAQPRINGVDLKARFRHYINIDRMEKRLTCLLDDFKWDRMDKVFFSELTAPRICPENLEAVS